MHFLTFKFFFAVVPLVILGYILGVLLMSFYNGWISHPAYIGLDGLGILIAFYNVRDKYMMG